MIEFIPIETGEPLDLAPDAEFEIQMEQPLLSNELPAPFSTQISFPPTSRNKAVFGFLGPDTMFEPLRKKVFCRIELFGLPYLDGTLVYDGIEEGNLQYTFTAQDILGLDSDQSGMMAALDISTMDVYAGLNGYTHSIMAPLIINEGQQAKEHGDDSNQVPIDTKYKNFYGLYGNKQYPGGIPVISKTEFIFTPALNLKDVFLAANFPENAARHLVVSSLLQPYLNQIAMVCPYKNKTWAASIFPFLGVDFITVPGNSIPKLTAKDILENLCKILCGFIYVENTAIHMVAADDVLLSAAVPLDMGIISDVYEASVLRAQNYKFKFGNDESENTYRPESAEGAADSPGTTSLANSHYDFWSPPPSENNEYKLFRHESNGVREDVYSRKAYTLYNITTLLCDNLYHNLGSCDNDAGADDTYDRSTNWKLVRCVPQNIVQPSGANNRHSRRVMTPIIPAISPEDERGDSVYIGLLKGVRAQLVDKGYYFGSNDDILNDGISLAPKDLYTPLHKNLAEWLSRDRQVLKVALNLTPAQLIGDISLWRRYYFAGRNWLIKTLTVKVYAGADRPEVEVEFVEA